MWRSLFMSEEQKEHVNGLIYWEDLGIGKGKLKLDELSFSSCKWCLNTPD
jgi:hypothetical protein